MPILQTSDFVNEYKVSQSRFTELASYITRYEKHYLLKLLGADLYAAFIADLTLITPQIPQTLRFENIFNPFNTIPSMPETLIVSNGMKEMLTQYVYFHYIRNSDLYNSITGTVQNSNENSVPSIHNNIIEVYNRAVVNFANIQCYIGSDTLTYPEVQNSSMDNIYFASGI